MKPTVINNGNTSENSNQNVPQTTSNNIQSDTNNNTNRINNDPRGFPSPFSAVSITDGIEVNTYFHSHSILACSF